MDPFQQSKQKQVSRDMLSCPNMSDRAVCLWERPFLLLPHVALLWVKGVVDGTGWVNSSERFSKFCKLTPQSLKKGATKSRPLFRLSQLQHFDGFILAAGCMTSALHQSACQDFVVGTYVHSVSACQGNISTVFKSQVLSSVLSVRSKHIQGCSYSSHFFVCKFLDELPRRLCSSVHRELLHLNVAALTTICPPVQSTIHSLNIVIRTQSYRIGPIQAWIKEGNLQAK